MIGGLLFDMDGTLLDTEAETGGAIDDAMVSAGLAPLVLPAAQTAGLTWSAILALMTERCPAAAAIGTEALLDAWMARVRRGCPPIPGAPDFLRRAAAAFRCAVVSSSPRHVIAELLELELPMVGGDEVEHGKPDAEPYLAGARLLGLDPSHCLVFEDSVAGLQSARAAGCGRIAILHSAGDPDACRALAEAAVPDFRALGDDFLERLRTEGRAAYATSAT